MAMKRTRSVTREVLSAKYLPAGSVLDIRVLSGGKSSRHGLMYDVATTKYGVHQRIQTRDEIAVVEEVIMAMRPVP
jgi:hypothetical protein